MDKSWINASRFSPSYIEGIKNFVEWATANSTNRGKVHCPCTKCCNRGFLSSNEVHQHLMTNGFRRDYKRWIFHGETIEQTTTSVTETARPTSSTNVGSGANIHELISEAFGLNRGNRHDMDVGSSDVQQTDDIPPEIVDDDQNNVAANSLLEDADVPLYPGCSNYSSLSFLLRLFHLKMLHGWSGKSFTMLLELLNDALPQGTTLPSTYYDCKKTIKKLDLGYVKIHACPHDCMLYWDGDGDRENCRICGCSRWDTCHNGNDELDEASYGASPTKKPAKVLRYFPLIPRLKRLFLSSKTAASMKWHYVSRTNDGTLRHPAVGAAWKAFDERWPEFASDPRNVRLGLASDGFNPFRTMNTTHSTWPVVLIPYNLEPWTCMKNSSLLFSMVIPGEKGPGNDIDIYLQPLIDELKQLWIGVEAYDASVNASFTLKAALFWTINDFPAYANLSGWSTKGRVACPVCASSTRSMWLRHGRKFCYMGHRRWLPMEHPFREQMSEFDETVEHEAPPPIMSGEDTNQQVHGLSFKYGKKCSIGHKRTLEQVRGRSARVNDGDFEETELTDEGNDIEADCHDVEHVLENTNTTILKKRSIFFDLPYWKHNLLRHNLDVMHIEKNVCDNVIGTLLNLGRKSKDNVMSRADLQVMGIRSELHPRHVGGKTQMPHASYCLTVKEKQIFLSTLQSLKVPDGYASNLSRCVNMKDKKLLGMKSHDGHILMQDLLPICLRSVADKKLLVVVQDLSTFFKTLCSKSLKPEDVDALQEHAALTLCHLEKLMPPSFFTIMVHLIIHLPLEVKLGGPVHYRWMYPIERFLVRLKALVRNRAYPEGSIAEGYIVTECLTFCSRYFADTETLFNRPSRNHEHTSSAPYLFASCGRIIGITRTMVLDRKSLAQAHRYVLLQCDSLATYKREFLHGMQQSYGNVPICESIRRTWLSEKFPVWLRQQVPIMNESGVSPDIIALAQGPNIVISSFDGFITNRYRFLTKSREEFRRTQNSGVMVGGDDGTTYYGRIVSMLQLDYYGTVKVTMFRCDWINISSRRSVKQDKNGFTMVNFSSLIHTGSFDWDDPFIISSQAKQVFYVEDGKDKGWFHVIPIKPRDVYDVGAPFNHEHDDEEYSAALSTPNTLTIDISQSCSWARI